MTEKRFTIEIIEDKDVFIQQKGANHYLGVNGYVNGGMVVDLLNELDEKYVDEFSLRETLQQELQRSEEENEQLKLELDTHKHPLWSTREAEKIVNELKQENEQLKSENKRLTDKLNKTALELVDGVISQGKATEISEMSYREFLDYRAKNGKPMELKK